jgi:hypothetical protein
MASTHAVELALVGEVLEVVLVGGDLGELGGGVGQQGAGVVDPEQPAAAGQHHREVLAGATGRVQDPAAGREPG